MEQRKPEFKYARLFQKQSGIFHIEWHNKNPKTGQLERIRKTFGLNRIEDVQERERTGQSFCVALNFHLDRGYNAFIHDFASFASVLEIDPTAEAQARKKDPLIDCLKHAYTIHCANKKPETLRTYKSVFKIFREWLEEQHLAQIDPNDFTPYHAQKYVQSREEYSAKNVNQHIVLIAKLFEVVMDILEAIQRNPFGKIKLRKETDSNRFEALTEDELKRIGQHLRATDLPFFAYTQFILYAFIRPGHIQFLQRKSIDFERNIIYIQGETTKSGRNAEKQLLRPLKETLVALGLDKLPPDYYLFGAGFQPSEKIYHRLSRLAQQRWKDVTEQLSIPKLMYALKHTGGQLYLSNNDNADPTWLQQQMEHSSLAETQTYIAKRKSKRLNESDINLPDF